MGKNGEQTYVTVSCASLPISMRLFRSTPSLLHRNQPMTREELARSVSQTQEAITRLRAFVRGKKSGGCRVLSVGDACDCELCAIDRLATFVHAAFDEVVRLRAAAQGGEAETRRLDWMEGAQWASYGSNNDGIGWTVGTRGFVLSYSFAQTLRAAIDAAMLPNAISADHGDGGPVG